MPTVENYYIDPDTGGSPARDYASLSAFESAKQQDLVTNDIQINALCRSTSGTADTTSVVFAGWTTDATRYIECRGIENHGGKYDSANYRLEDGSGIAWRNNYTGGANHCKIINLQFRTTNINFSAIRHDCSDDSAHWLYVERSIFYGPGPSTGSSTAIIHTRQPTKYVSNCIFIDYRTAFGTPAGPSYSYNNTVHNCNTGYNGSSTHRAKNCVADDCGDGFSGTFHADSNYNASDIASDAPGLNSQNGTATTFVNEAADDFHLSTSDAVCLDNGTDLSSDPDYPISVDNENATRTGTWDIGAHQAAAAAGITGRITALDLDLTYDPKTGRITAADVDINYDLKTGRITAADLDINYDLKTGRITAADLDVTYDLKTGRVTAADLDLTYAVKTGRITAADLDLTYDLKTGRITAADLDVNYDLKTGRVTALDLDVNYVTDLGGRITALDLDLTYTPKTGRITAADLDLTYSLKTGRITAADLDIVYATKAGRITALDIDVVHELKTGRLTALDVDVTHDLKTGRISALDVDVVYFNQLGRIVALDVDITYTTTVSAADDHPVRVPKEGRGRRVRLLVSDLNIRRIR